MNRRFTFIPNVTFKLTAKTREGTRRPAARASVMRTIIAAHFTSVFPIGIILLLAHLRGEKQLNRYFVIRNM
jgi:hypothetical protein